MSFKVRTIAWLLCYTAVAVSQQDDDIHTTRNQNEWVVRITGGPRVAKRLANEFGYTYGGPVLGFQNTYLLWKNPNLYSRHQKRGFYTNDTLENDHRVIWADEQRVTSRQKRDYLFDDSIEIKINEDYPIKFDVSFNDELWSQQWYLKDMRSDPDLPKIDLNVLPVYQMGFSGRGVRVTILDDGLEYTHEDLWYNYDPDISWDCNENDSDPIPRYNTKQRNSHGTRCAGEVAMIANNIKCGIGVAFNARIGGVKLLDGFINDRVEGTALGVAYNLVDIYSASWGPNDDGRTLEGPGRLALEALERGVTLGRNGKGSIFVWASGNGGKLRDNCNCDGYVGSPYTVAIGSASQRGEFPWYGEACASILAVTYSSGAYQDQMIATTDLHNSCTVKHTGTSASAPLAAGIIALVLEANPTLTWRDIQHLIVWTSEYLPVADNVGWQVNAIGLRFNTRFGFGLMNAFGLVQAALNWTTVPPKSICKIEKNTNDTKFSRGEIIRIYFATVLCAKQKSEINFLEHIEVIININYPNRGTLEIYLISPSGTRVQLLSPRKYDTSKKGFKDWKLMSVMTWGENPEGIWTLEIFDMVGTKSYEGHLGIFTLLLHGSKEIPVHMLKGRRKYNKYYNSIQNI